MIIFRDDDVSKDTNLQQFAAVHRLFIDYGLVHTIGLITRELDYHTALVYYINSHKSAMSLQLHCHNHRHFPQLSDAEIVADFRAGIAMIGDLFGTKPVTWYPPWNDTDARVNKLALSMGLRADPAKCSLDLYIQNRGQNVAPTINFHHWAAHETAQLERAMKIATGK